MLKVRARRIRCPVTGCTVQTFREQVPGVLDRYQRRTARLSMQVSAVARKLAGRASARLLPALGIAAVTGTVPGLPDVTAYRVVTPDCCPVLFLGGSAAFTIIGESLPYARFRWLWDEVAWNGVRNAGLP